MWGARERNRRRPLSAGPDDASAPRQPSLRDSRRAGSGLRRDASAGRRYEGKAVCSGNATRAARGQTVGTGPLSGRASEAAARPGDRAGHAGRPGRRCRDPELRLVPGPGGGGAFHSSDVPHGAPAATPRTARRSTGSAEDAPLNPAPAHPQDASAAPGAASPRPAAHGVGAEGSIHEPDPAGGAGATARYAGRRRGTPSLSPVSSKPRVRHWWVTP